jgi:tetratricopeptide (TPR) repeat protein
MDILTLACLTGIVPHAFKDPGAGPVRHAAELLGLARWLRQSGEMEQARALFARAVDAGLNDELLFRTLWDMTALDRKLGDSGRALERLEELASAHNPFRARALEELAKHHEHHTRDYTRALDLTRTALTHEESPALRHREQRLLRRVAAKSVRTAQH